MDDRLTSEVKATYHLNNGMCYSELTNRATLFTDTELSFICIETQSGKELMLNTRNIVTIEVEEVNE